jgi:DNA polymerase-3 subunit delta
MAGAVTFEQAYSELRRGTRRRVYYLTGPEDALKDELVALIIEQTLGTADPAFNLDIRSAGSVDAESLVTLIDTPPLLAESRVVVLKNLEEWRPNAKVWAVLLRYLSKPADQTVLALVAGSEAAPRADVAKLSCHVAVTALEPARVRRWIERRATQRGCTIDADAVTHLLDAVGLDLGQLGTELDKLAAAAPSDRIDVELVAALVGIRRGETLPEFVAAVLHRDTDRAVRMLPAVLSAPGASGVRILSTLGTALVGVRLAIALTERGVSVRRLEDAIFREIRAARPAGLADWKREASAWARAAPRWTSAALDRAIAEGLVADRALKSTTLTDELGILTEMLLRMIPERAAA